MSFSVKVYVVSGISYDIQHIDNVFRGKICNVKYRQRLWIFIQFLIGKVVH